MGFLRSISSAFLLYSFLVFTSGASTKMEQEQQQRALTDSVNQFSLQFYKQTAAEIPDKNLIMSPLSAEIILALLSLGARGETQKQLHSALHLPDEQFTKAAFKPAIEELNSVKNATLKIANKVFVKEHYTLANEFKKSAVDIFFSEAQNLDFNNGVAAANVINSWVEDRTNNRIKDLIKSDSLTADTRLVLVNAIYFKGMWKTPFRKEATYKQDFFLTENNKVQVDMMHLTAHFRYADVPEWNAKVLELPYTGDELSMVIILPNEIEGLKNVEEKLATSGNLNDVLNKLRSVEVNVALPKFRIETEIDLTKVLPKLGMGIIFDQNKADLSGLLNNNEQLYVSDAIQKAFIEVNEEGAEAAAATGFVIMCRMMPIRMQFEADHPFYYAIVSGQKVLFVGKVMNLVEGN